MEKEKLNQLRKKLIRKYLIEGMKQKDMAKKLGLSQGAISLLIREFGLKPNPRGRRKPKRDYPLNMAHCHKCHKNVEIQNPEEKITKGVEKMRYKLGTCPRCGGKVSRMLGKSE